MEKDSLAEAIPENAMPRWVRILNELVKEAKAER
jgi:hypothetical protein